MGRATHYIRFEILRREGTDRAESQEEREIFTEPPDGEAYDGMPLGLNAGEEIRQGVKEGTNFLKMQVRGRLRISGFDRLRLKDSGQVYRLTAPPIYTRRETILSCESL